MKKIVTVTEVEGEGFVSLLGKQVMIFCMNYIYTGTLTGVNTTCILLEKAAIVYSTGDFKKNSFEDAQALTYDLYVQTNSIESFSETNKKV
jgi:hypothetical protein